MLSGWRKQKRPKATTSTPLSRPPIAKRPRTNETLANPAWMKPPRDAEDAERIVRRVFDHVVVKHWDAPLTRLPDRQAVLDFCRSHHLPVSAADRVEPPVTLTKRECLVVARR